MEYFSYFNLWLMMLFLFLCLFFLIFSSCQLLITSWLCSGAVFEFSLIFMCFFFIVIIMSPALIMLLDAEIMMVPSFLVYSCGYQWAWSFSFYYNSFICFIDHYLLSSYYLSFNASSFFALTFNVPLSSLSFALFLSSSFLLLDYFVSSFNRSSFYLASYILSSSFLSNYCMLTFSHALSPLSFFSSLLSLYSLLNLLLASAIFISLTFNVHLTFLSNLCSCLCYGFNLLALIPTFNLSLLSFYFNFNYLNSSLLSFSSLCALPILLASSSLLYFFTCNSVLLIPCFTSIRFFVFSYDVIHSFSIYSFGIKIDAIPGSFNYASTLRTLIKGEHSGFCYELCGHGHSSMLLIAKTS